jgi:hypothetical protein
MTWIIWIVFGFFMCLLSALFLGGICHSAGLADREIERLEALDREARQ